MTGIIIQARLGSTRLPQKVLMGIAGKPVIAHVVDRCQETGLPVVLAVPHEEAEFFKPWVNAPIFEGHPTDVLDRFCEVARSFKFDPIVRVTGDCPLIQPEMILAMLKTFEGGYLSNVHPIRTVPKGFDLEVFSFSALDYARAHAVDPQDREHVTRYFYSSPRVVCRTYAPPFPADWNCSIDTPEDFERVRAIIEEGKAPWLN